MIKHVVGYNGQRNIEVVPPPTQDKAPELGVGDHIVLFPTMIKQALPEHSPIVSAILNQRVFEIGEDPSGVHINEYGHVVIPNVGVFTKAAFYKISSDNESPALSERRETNEEGDKE